MNSQTVLSLFQDIFQFQSQFFNPATSLYFDFSDVVFKKDFGSWKKGDVVNLLCFSVDQMSLREYDTDYADENPGADPEYKNTSYLTFAPKEDYKCPTLHQD